MLQVFPLSLELLSRDKTEATKQSADKNSRSLSL